MILKNVCGHVRNGYLMSKYFLCFFFPPQVCKSCIVKHFFYSNKCPTCSIVVHQTQPLYNIRWVWLFWSYRNHLSNFLFMFFMLWFGRFLCQISTISRQFWFRWLYRAGEERGTAVSSYSLSWFGAAFQPIMLICLVSYEADLPRSSICKVFYMLNNHYVHI